MDKKKKKSNLNFKTVNKKAKIEKKSRKLYNYSPQKIEMALKEVENGMSVLAAARKFGVPRETIRDKKRSGTSNVFRVGPDPVLGFEIENKLESWLLDISRRGAPIPVEGLCYSVQYLCRKKKLKTKFTDDKPGRKWVAGFFRRHPTLTVKKSEYLSHQRALLTESAIRGWFGNVRQQLREENIDLSVLQDPKRIFNLDETALYTNPSGHLVIAERGKTANSIGSSDKENATILFTADADGTIVTELILLPYERLPSPIVKLIPKDWNVGKTGSGWMTAEAFYEYIGNVFIPYLQKSETQLPVVVFLDGHASHLSYPLSDLCAENKIIIICLPPNATHFIQPLDVGFYGPFKRKWQKFTKLYKLRNEGLEIKKQFLPKFINEMGLDFFGLDIKKAFKVCGLFPFDENNLPYEKLVTHQNIIPDAKAVREAEKPGDPLKVIESKIDENILEDFKLTRSMNMPWAGDLAYLALFDLWKMLKSEIEGEPTVYTATVDNILDSSGCCDFIVTDSNSEGLSQLIFDGIPELDLNRTITSNQTFQPTEVSSPVVVVTPSAVAVPAIITPAVTEMVNNVLPDKSNVSEKIPELEVVGDLSSDISNVNMEVTEPVPKNNVADSSDKIMKSTVTSSNISNSSSSEIRGILPVISSEVPETSSSNKIPSPINSKSPLVEDVLASIVLFPKKDKSSKTKVNKKHLPSVISSQKWRDLFNAKDEAKRQKEEARVAAKTKRVENKKLKEEQKKKKKAPKRRHEDDEESWQSELLAEQSVDNVDEIALETYPVPLPVDIPVTLPKLQKTAKSKENLNPKSEIREENPNKINTKISINQFVVVRLEVPVNEMPKRKKNGPNATRDYVAKVIHISNDKLLKYTVRFLRPYQAKEKVFIFPNIQDQGIISVDQILKVLPQPNEKRGLFHFIKNPLLNSRKQQMKIII